MSKISEELDRACHSVALHPTAQWNAVREFLARRHGHATAEETFREENRSDPRASRSLAPPREVRE